MLSAVKSIGPIILATVALTFAPFVSAVTIDTPANPYLTIVERNPFAIKPIPPPAAVEAPPPVVPLAKVVLTGVISIFGPPRALFEITEQEPGKAPTVNKRTLSVGDKDGAVEVLSIDVEHSSVRIKNGTVVTNVVFEVAKSTPTGPAPPPGALPPPPAPTTASAGAAAPMIFSRGGVEAPGRAGSGVSLAGAEENAPQAQTPGSTSYAANTYGANALGNRMGNNLNNSVTAASTDQGQTVSTARDVRTDTMAQRLGSRRTQLDSEVQLEELKHNLPFLSPVLPDTRLTKLLQQQQ